MRMLSTRRNRFSMVLGAGCRRPPHRDCPPADPLSPVRGKAQDPIHRNGSREDLRPRYGPESACERADRAHKVELALQRRSIKVSWTLLATSRLVRMPIATPIAWVLRCSLPCATPWCKCSRPQAKDAALRPLPLNPSGHAGAGLRQSGGRSRWELLRHPMARR